MGEYLSQHRPTLIPFWTCSKGYHVSSYDGRDGPDLVGSAFDNMGTVCILSESVYGGALPLRRNRRYGNWYIDCGRVIVSAAGPALDQAPDFISRLNPSIASTGVGSTPYAMAR